MAKTPNADLPLTEQFVRYGRYVRNWSPRTVECYRQALRECPASIARVVGALDLSLAEFFAPFRTK